MMEQNSGGGGRTTLLKVVILGDGGVGKSCLMSRFVSNHFDEHSFHTIGVEFMNKTVEVGGRTYTLQVWDTAGQERFKSLRTPFYRGADICLLAYAVDDRASFANVRMWLDEFLHYAGVASGGGGTGGVDRFPIVVVGNKSDVPPAEREVAREQLRQWCAEHRVAAFIETSAKRDDNVLEAFSMAVQRWVELEQAAERELGALHHADAVRLSARGAGASIGPARATACCAPAAPPRRPTPDA